MRAVWPCCEKFENLAPGVHVLHITYNLVISVARFTKVPKVFGVSQFSSVSQEKRGFRHQIFTIMLLLVLLKT